MSQLIGSSDNSNMNIATVIWSGNFIQGFVTEASDLNANRHIRPRNQCPHCNGFFGLQNLVRRLSQGKGEDMELAGWVFKCPNCYVKLTVFND